MWADNTDSHIDVKVNAMVDKTTDCGEIYTSMGDFNDTDTDTDRLFVNIRCA